MLSFSWTVICSALRVTSATPLTTTMFRPMVMFLERQFLARHHDDALHLKARILIRLS
jgi:hypothetical protein